MKNVTQSLLFPVSALTPSKLEADVAELSQRVRNTKMALQVESSKPEANAETVATLTAELDKSTAELTEKTPDPVKNELTFFGAKLTSDDVTVNMRLGHVFYDIFLAAYPEETAPLKKMIQQNRRAELAGKLDEEEFELPSYALPYLRKTLMDEAAWANMSLNVWVDIPAAEGQDAPQKRFFTMNSKGTQYFGQVLQAAASALYTEDMLNAEVKAAPVAEAK